MKALLVCLALLFTTGARADEAANMALVLDLYQNVVAGGDVERADQLLTADYIQHNPNIASGLEGFKAYFTDIHAQVEIELEVLDIRADGDLVMIHVREVIASPYGEIVLVAYDRFRIENGRLAEHWDVVQGETFWDRFILEFAG